MGNEAPPKQPKQSVMLKRSISIIMKRFTSLPNLPYQPTNQNAFLIHSRSFKGCFVMACRTLCIIGAAY